MGHSGCGKTTLINILGLINDFDAGEYLLFNKNVNNLNDKELSYLRMKNIGYVFQNYYLIPTLKAYENIEVSMLISKDIEKKDRKEKVLNLLKNINLDNHANHYPSELSGGSNKELLY